MWKCSFCSCQTQREKQEVIYPPRHICGNKCNYKHWFDGCNWVLLQRQRYQWGDTSDIKYRFGNTCLAAFTTSCHCHCKGMYGSSIPVKERLHLNRRSSPPQGPQMSSILYALSTLKEETVARINCRVFCGRFQRRYLHFRNHIVTLSFDWKSSRLKYQWPHMLLTLQNFYMVLFRIWLLWRAYQKLLLAQQFATVNCRDSEIFQRSQQLILATVKKKFHSIHDFLWQFPPATVASLK